MFIGSDKTTGIESIMEVSNLINRLPCLDETESTYEPEMVPVRESSRLGKNMIRLEDLVEYSVANGITDAGYAISSVCEAASISPESVVFTVQESNILSDYNMFETAKAFMNENATVLVSPVCTRE